MTMNWGIELWDQYDSVSQHTQKGIDFLERYGNFLRDRASIEVEYAGKLRKLVKAYFPKKKEEEDCQFTSSRGFKEMLEELGCVAGQHELVAEALADKVVKEIGGRVRELKDEKKRGLGDGAKYQSSLSAQLSGLERAKRNYEKAFRESEKAYEAFQRADADLNLSRAEVEKTRLQSQYKSQQCEESKKEYASQLDKTNELQTSFYKVNMPSVFQCLQDLDERRTRSFKNFLIEATEAEKNVYPILNKCLEGILRSASQINEVSIQVKNVNKLMKAPTNFEQKLALRNLEWYHFNNEFIALISAKDCQQVIDRLKTGFSPPEDIPFEDLSAMNNFTSSHPPSNGTSVRISSSSDSHSLTYKGTLSGGKLKKRTGIFNIFSNQKGNNGGEGRDDYSELPPNQRRKKLQQKIDEFNNKIQLENAAKDGLTKMQMVYQSNPALGDAGAIEGQLRESLAKLQKLQLEVSKYGAYLAEVDSPLPPPGSYVNGRGSSGHNRSSGSDESLSRSASDLSTHQNISTKASAPSTPLPSHYGSSNSPESGISTSHTSLPDSDFEHIDAEGGEFLEQDLLPVLGTCDALYPFEASSEGSIRMSDGEILLVVELDQGDGWTRVRRQNSLEEGFVPTSYIKISLYTTC